jgi:hypothetical protein
MRGNLYNPMVRSSRILLSHQTIERMNCVTCDELVLGRDKTN